MSHPLTNRLRDEHAAMQEFLELLQEEQQFLVQGDADRVAGGLERKSRLLKILARHAEQRKAFLASQNLAADRKGMDAWIAAQPAAETLASEWHELLEITHQAWRANQSNGALIATHLQANQQALTALVAAGRTGSLYGRDGQTMNPWGSRTLGAA